MLKLLPILLSATLVAFSASAKADDATPAPSAPVAPPAPSAQTMPVNIPKTKGAYMIVAISPPQFIPYSSAQACEEERDRIKAQVTTICIWVR